jgi:hypothetical protein
VDDAAIDRIIHAVQHWGDDPDPFQQWFNYAREDFVQEFIRRWEKRHGKGSGGVFKINVKFGNGDKFSSKTEWF